MVIITDFLNKTRKFFIFQYNQEVTLIPLVKLEQNNKNKNRW